MIRNIILCLIAIYSLLVSPILLNIQAFAEEPEKIDMIAPTIIHSTPTGRFFKGDKIIISSVISDNEKVVKATLFFRSEGGNNQYQSVDMMKLAGEEYRAEIPGSVTNSPSVEYYIEAIDDAENHTIRGFSNTPLVILVSEPPVQHKIVPIQPDEVTPIEKHNDIQFEKNTTLETYKTSEAAQNSEPEALNSKPWYKQWWVWTIAGAVIIGAAASSGGGGNDSSSTETTNGTVRVSVPSP